MSKTKPVCETFSIVEVDNIKAKQFCETSFKNGKLSAELTASDQCVLQFFHSICLYKVLRLPGKSEARSYEVLHLSRKITLANLKIWCSKMQPLSGNQRPDLRTSLMNMSLVPRLARQNAPLQILVKSPMPGANVFETAIKLHILLAFRKVQNPPATQNDIWTERPKLVRDHQLLALWLGNVLRATTACTFSTSQLPKVVREYTLTSTCVSRHNSVHFFDMSTSKSAPVLVCFVHFDFDMCFAPQRRALFQHRNFQKCLENEILLTFWLLKVLCATAVCNFSSFIWPDGFAPAALASLLFDPPEPQIIGKRSESRLFYLFARLHLLSSASFSSTICSLLLFSSLTLPISAFCHLSILSEIWLLDFLRIRFLWDFLRILWGSYKISIVFPGDFYGFL